MVKFNQLYACNFAKLCGMQMSYVINELHNQVDYVFILNESPLQIGLQLKKSSVDLEHLSYDLWYNHLGLT